MKKEILAVCIILVLIIIINMVCQKYLSKAVDEICKQLEELGTMAQEYLDDENADMDIKKQIKHTSDEWEMYRKNLSLYIEHDELEKVATSMALVDSYIDIENYEDAVPEIRQCIFILDHIKKKEKICISNLL